MPTYCYKCDACDYEFEAKQKITEEPLTHCPQCHAEDAKRIIKFANAPVLKGKGWFGKGGSKGGY